MERKLKTCSKCGKERPLWKSVPKLCKQCAYDPKPIPAKSAHRIADDKVYNTLSKVFIESKNICEAQLEGCTHWATAVHHLHSGKDRDKYYLVVKTWKAVCGHCHHVIHDVLTMEEAVALDLKRVEP